MGKGPVVLDWDAGRDMAVDRSAPRTAAEAELPNEGSPIGRCLSSYVVREHDLTKDVGLDELQFAGGGGGPHPSWPQQGWPPPRFRWSSGLWGDKYRSAS